MRVLEIDQDMDHAGMFEWRELFDRLARRAEDVRLDLSKVRVMDSAGIDGLVSLHRTLRQRALKISVVGTGGQPLRLLGQAPLCGCDRHEWLHAGPTEGPSHGK